VAMPSCVFTIGYVARMLGESEDVIEDIVMSCMGPAEGTLSIYDGTPDHSVTAFTDRGIENLRELLADRKNW
jgi:hypothetical protein